MFLVEIWDSVAGVIDKSATPDFRISTQYYAFTDPWDEGLIDISGISYGVDTPHGGMIRSKFGILTVLPTVTSVEYIGVDVFYSNGDDTDKQLLFSGVAYVNSRTRTVISYDLFTNAPNVQIETELSFNSGTDTLVSVFSDYCTKVGWTLISTLAASTNIDVEFKAATGQLYSDLLANLCQTYGHYFIVDAVAEEIHLREIDKGVGTTVVIDAFEYFPSKYSYNIPPSKVTIGDGVAYNSPFYFGAAKSLNSYTEDLTLNNTLSANIRDIYTNNPYEFELHMPLEYFVAKGVNFITTNKIQWTEEVVQLPGLTGVFEMVINGISFNVREDKVTLTGFTIEV